MALFIIRIHFIRPFFLNRFQLY